MNEEQTAQIDNEAESDSSTEQTTMLGAEPEATEQAATSEDEAQQAEQETEQETEQEQGAPEEYADFEVPEGIEIPEALGSQFREAAKGMNLTQEQAQQLISLQSEHALKQQQAAQDKFMEQVQAWEAQVKEDKEFGGSKLEQTLATATRALDKYGTPELKDLLNSSGLGNHPEMVRFVARVGQSVSEDSLEVGSQPSGNKSRAEILYG